MGRAYSMDLRQRAMDRVAAGETCHAVAAALNVAPSSVIKWAQRQRRTGSVAPDKMGGRRPALITGAYRVWVLSMINGPDHVTLEWLARGLRNAASKSIPPISAAFSIARAKASKKTVLPAEQNRPKLARQRERWKRHQGKVDPHRLVFIDETWVKTNMAPLRGWGERGKRLVAHVPHGHWRAMTFVAALRSDRVDAPWVLNGPINANAFLIYIEKELAKTLSPGDFVVLDNLGSHKGQAVRRAIRTTGAKLIFLPPYSPDLNPIEQLFSKIKQAMRTAMACSEETVHNALARTVTTVQPTECANYIRNAGYGST